MGTSRKALIELSHRAISLFFLPKPSSPTIGFLSSRRLLSSSFSKSTSSIKNDKPPQSNRDSMLLEKFRLRKKKGSSKTTQKGNENGLVKGDETVKVMSGFMELGICKEMVEAVEELGFFVPSELHCVGIAAIFQGKNVVLGSPYGADRALAYLLPFIQSLKREGERNGIRSKHPRAVVLCSTEELADEVFQMAKFISNHGQLKSSRDNSCVQLELKEGASDVSIGMLVGTPDEVSELIEEGNVLSDEIKYLVLDELDTMFDNGFGPSIEKILSSIKHSTSKHYKQKCQSVLVSSTIVKMLHEQHSSLVKSLKHDDADEIASILLELEEDEAFRLIESPDTLKSKVADAVESLHPPTRES